MRADKWLTTYGCQSMAIFEQVIWTQHIQIHSLKALDASLKTSLEDQDGQHVWIKNIYASSTSWWWLCSMILATTDSLHWVGLYVCIVVSFPHLKQALNKIVFLYRGEGLKLYDVAAFLGYVCLNHMLKMCDSVVVNPRPDTWKNQFNKGRRK